MRDNKLIAEFMGLSIKEGVCYYTDADDMFPMGIEVEEPYLPYHISWDWLMPVVEKISKSLDIDQLIECDEWLNIRDELMTARIETVYNAVVEFIKQYNDEQNKAKAN